MTTTQDDCTQDDPDIEFYLIHTALNHVRACPNLELAESSLKPGDILYRWQGRLGQLYHLGKLETVAIDEDIERAIKSRAEEGEGDE